MTVVMNQQFQHNEDEYGVFLNKIEEHFNSTVKNSGGVLFATDSGDVLFDIFLEELPEDVKQRYTCSACRKFVNSFGSIVSITEEGKTVSAMWPDEVPELYQASVDAIKKAVSKSKVVGVFYADGKAWGQPVTGKWNHMSVVPNGVSFSSPVKTPFQAMAEKREDYRTLVNALAEFPIKVVEQALLVLKTNSLYRSEKVLGVAEWLMGVHGNRAVKNKRIRDNLTWLAVATAPVDFCHVKSSMIGTLLEDIASGLSFEEISRRFADKMHPLQYQRPQSPPSAGNIAQAEKLIARLKSAGSLERRFARLDELQLIWEPIIAEEQPRPLGDGVFSHIKPKGATEVKNLDIPVITMTWRKFHHEALPVANKIEFHVPHSRYPYTALVTAVNADSPPILQWDTEKCRNPVSWYLYHGGSYPNDWNLKPGEWRNVTGITFYPSMWNGGFEHHGRAVMLVLDGAIDKKWDTGGGSFFPEMLKSELHGIRRTIEAYSRDAVLEGAGEASACGVALLDQKTDFELAVRVTTLDGYLVRYSLDRWD